MKKKIILAVMLIIACITYSQDEEINFFNPNNITNVPFFAPQNFTGGEIYFAISPINSGKNDIATALNSSDGIVTIPPVVNNYYRRATWNLNNGNGSFGNVNSYFISENYSGSQNWNIIKGCVFIQLRDNEPRKDLVVGRSTNNGIWVHWNNGNISGVQQTVSGNVSAIDKGKFDNSDNREDIIIKEGTQIRIFQNLGNGSLSSNSIYNFQPVTNQYFSYKLKQMNDKDYDAGYWPNNENDKADLVVLDGAAIPSNLKVYINSNNNTFGNSWQQIQTDQSAYNLHVADIDGDGFNDVMVSGGFNGTNIYMNIQGAFLQPQSVWNYSTFTGGTFATTGDLNKDGFTDLVLVHANRIIQVFLNTKNYPFYLNTPDQTIEAGHQDRITQIELSDIYNTGGLGLIISDWMSHTGPIMIESNLKVVNALNFNPKPQPVVIKGDLYFDGTFYRPRITVNTNKKEKDYQTYAYAKFNRETGQTSGFFLNSDVYIDYSEYVLPGGAGPDWNRYYYVQQIDQTNQISVNSNQVNFMVGSQGTGCAGCEGGDMPNTNNSLIIPDKYLTTNFPNPFNPVTKIYYTLPVSGNVKIEIYDLIGQKIQTLQNDYKDIGSYIVEFDGSNLSSGLYFYRIESNNYIVTKKMLLIK